MPAATPTPARRPTAAPATPAVSAPAATTVSATPNAQTEAATPPRYAYPHQRADGNRLAEGQGGLPDVAPLDVPLRGVPRWVLGVSSSPGESLWVAVLEDGTTQTVQVRDGVAYPGDGVGALPPEQPPVLQAWGDVALFQSPEAALPPSPLSPPVPLASFDPTVLDETWLDPAWADRAWLQRDGTIVVGRGDVFHVLEGVTALPDARLLTDERSRLLFLSAPTDRYEHGVLGDALEASAITLVETVPEPRVAMTIEAPAPAVFEGIAPLWVDLDGDGTREIIVTESDRERGARLVLFSEAGTRLAESPAIGSGFRWRHQIAVGPLGPTGETEIVSVRTPHIGGIVEWFRWERDTLRLVAELPGFSSHSVGSRNLDMAAAGDWDGDGRWELLVPTQDYTALGAVRRTASSAAVAWTLPLDGQLSTNLATVTDGAGRLSLALGLVEGRLRVWP